MVNQLQQLQKEIDKINRKIRNYKDNLVDKLIAQRDKLFDEYQRLYNESILGKTYVYRRNSYSCPTKESDYWDVYAKVIEAKDTKIKVLCVEKDSNKNIQITNESWYKNVTSGYVECSNEEFEKVFVKLMNELDKQGGIIHGL